MTRTISVCGYIEWNEERQQFKFYVLNEVTDGGDTFHKVSAIYKDTVEAVRSHIEQAKQSGIKTLYFDDVPAAAAKR